MSEHLLQLLKTLQLLGNRHGEIYDSLVRERIGEAVMERFVRHNLSYEIPIDLGLATIEANSAVHHALEEYVRRANRTAEKLEMTRFHDRLNAFQNPHVRVDPNQDIDYEELFGHTPPEWYDLDGNVISDRIR